MRRLLLSLIVLAGACSTTQVTPATPAPVTTTTVATTVTTVTTAAPTTTHSSTTTTTAQRSYLNLVDRFEYRGGLVGDIHAPAALGPWPVVVTVHGGGWYVGEPASMSPLAGYLAGEGIVVFNLAYRTMSLGGAFPDMVDDVACGVAEARRLAPRYTNAPETVTIIGHSAGAHLAALVAFAPEEFECSEGAPDSFVGLAGPYDTNQLEIILTPFFGTRLAEDPEPWNRGNPLTYAEDLSGEKVLLLHGELDTVVPTGFSRVLADAIDTEANELTFEILTGVDHTGITAPAVVGDLIVAFVNDQ